jgi:hypothetical protein
VNAVLRRAEAPRTADKQPMSADVIPFDKDERLEKEAEREREEEAAYVAEWSCGKSDAEIDAFIADLRKQFDEAVARGFSARLLMTICENVCADLDRGEEASNG